VQSTNQNSKPPKLHIILSFKSFFNWMVMMMAGGGGRVHEKNKNNKHQQTNNNKKKIISKLVLKSFIFMSQLLQ